ncbi:MAG: cellulase family glycosylhydrolase [Duncaniella sp.]|nr:cellulase family glycosylhydrolase [Duncaniella sp.]HBI59273.1 beta-mannosidase [Porphyromonadaceae bacterium]
MKLLPLAAAAVLIAASCSNGKNSTTTTEKDDNFITVKNGEFYDGDSVYRYIGTNFWYGPLLASDGSFGNRERLAAELDSLQAIGIDNLRVLAGGDGPDGLASHIEPNLQTAPGVYNDTILRGLDYFIAELEKRGMKAVIYLNNAWEWSGGYSAYLEWAGHGKAVIPSVDGWPAYMDYVKQFVQSDSAKTLAANHVRNIVTRTNSVTGRPYSESPAIMSWQIANEPRAFGEDNKEAFAEWIGETARLIKSLDTNHLVSVGSEGSHGCEEDIELWTRIHSFPEVDYGTIHIWPYNWSWISESTVTDSVAAACRNTDAYIDAHHARLSQIGKPIVLEEFGYPRDGMATPVTGRDNYYSHVFSQVRNTGKIAGVNFWGWGGLAVPAHDTWQHGDDYTGDPAQEPQGLNSVFACDTTTIAIIRAAAKR